MFIVGSSNSLSTERKGGLSGHAGQIYSALMMFRMTKRTILPAQPAFPAKDHSSAPFYSIQRLKRLPERQNKLVLGC